MNINSHLLSIDKVSNEIYYVTKHKGTFSRGITFFSLKIKWKSYFKRERDHIIYIMKKKFYTILLEVNRSDLHDKYSST